MRKTQSIVNSASDSIKAAPSNINNDWNQRIAREIRDKLMPLTPAKRIDAILKNEVKWAGHKAVLLEQGISWSDVVRRKSIMDARKQKKEDENLKLAEAIMKSEFLKEHGITIAINKNDRLRPVRIHIPVSDMNKYHDVIIDDEIYHSLRRLFIGFVVNGYHECRDDPNLAGSVKSLHKLADSAKELIPQIYKIIDLTPGSVETINSTDAAALARLSKTTFKEAVKEGLFPIAGTVEFHKWGNILTANVFEIRDIIEARDGELLQNYITERDKKKVDRRKGGAIKAKKTRERRDKIRQQMTEDMRVAVADAVQKSGSIAAGLHLELFTWAQRASRLAKTSPSLLSSAYALKFNALKRLVQADAVDVAFLDSSQLRLISKCRHHEGGWHDMAELLGCGSCEVINSHGYSLYSLHLKENRQAGGLHVPYDVGLAGGFPHRELLDPADHGRSEAYGRSLDQDEAAIFTLKTIHLEIRQAIRALDKQSKIDAES